MLDLIESHGVDTTDPDSAVQPDWVVPGLLAAGERVIFSGPGGVGKSTLERQVAVAVASGIHPFTAEPIPRQRTLLVDAQEDEDQAASELVRPIRAAGDRYERGNCRLVLAPSIVPDTEDLDEDDDLGEIVLGNLLRICDEHEPTLIALGPLYRMAELLGIQGEIGEPGPARALQRWLDQLRKRSGAALVLEGHGGHGQKRVLGTVWWVNWPNFGYDLNRSGTITRWREDRDRINQRAFPARLHKGEDGDWPWVAARSAQAREIDERRAVIEVAVRDTGKTSDRAIAEATGIPRTTVQRNRRENLEWWEALLLELDLNEE